MAIAATSTEEKKGEACKSWINISYQLDTFCDLFQSNNSRIINMISFVSFNTVCRTRLIMVPIEDHADSVNRFEMDCRNDPCTLYAVNFIVYIKLMIQGGPERMQRLWSLISRTSSRKRNWFLFYYVKILFSNKMTPWSLMLGKASES